MEEKVSNPKYSFQALFVFLLIALLVPSIFHDFVYVQYISNGVFTVLLLMAVYTMSQNKTYFYLTLVFAILTSITSWYNVHSPELIAEVLDNGLNILFFAYLITLFGRQIFRTREITSDTIFGTLCIYFLIGFFWAAVFMVMDAINPNSFDMGDHAHSLYSYLYYSFITLSTLGYGDIVPKTPPAQVLAVLETVIGQFFIAVVVSRYVGILVSQKNKNF